MVYFICSHAGFDCEWFQQGKVRRPIALLQFASHRGLCILIQMHRMQTIPKELIVSKISIKSSIKIVNKTVPNKAFFTFNFKGYS